MSIKLSFKRFNICFNFGHGSKEKGFQQATRFSIIKEYKHLETKEITFAKILYQLW